MQNEEHRKRRASHLELRLFLGQFAELSAETESTEHGILRGYRQVCTAGDATIGVDARQRELQQVILSAIAALQTSAGYLVWIWNDVAFLGEHGNYVIQIFLAGQRQRSHTRSKLRVVNRAVENGLREGSHVHLVAFLLVQTVQQTLHHQGLVGVNSNQQSFMNLPEVKLDPVQESIHGVLIPQADGEV